MIADQLILFYIFTLFHNEGFIASNVTKLRRECRRFGRRWSCLF